jgi:hypothetical protein
VAGVGHRELPHVEAGAEAAAGPGDNQGLDSLSDGQPPENGDGFLAQRDRQRVFLLRAVERHDSDATVLGSAAQHQRGTSMVRGIVCQLWTGPGGRPRSQGGLAGASLMRKV